MFLQVSFVGLPIYTHVRMFLTKSGNIHNKHLSKMKPVTKRSI